MTQPHRHVVLVHITKASDRAPARLQWNRILPIDCSADQALGNCMQIHTHTREAVISVDSALTTHDVCLAPATA